MLNSRSQSIVKIVKEVQEPLKRLASLLLIEDTALLIAQGDVESAEERKKILLDELSALEQKKQDLKAEAASILVAARNQAKEIFDAENLKRAEHTRILDEVKEFCRGIDKKRYMELKMKMDRELVAPAA